MRKDQGPGQRETALVFPSLDNLLGGFFRLVQDYPGQAEPFSYGLSRQGESLLALRLGNGPGRVLVYAFPQPDEPLGGVALLRLAQRLLEDDGLRQRATWTLLPCVDPDGARRNEGWFTAPLDLGTYVRRHFRPPEGEQVEWAFPSDNPAWPWDSPLPETRALQALIEDVRPALLLPLHNALVGGAYSFLSEGAAALAPALPTCWRARELPTHQENRNCPLPRSWPRGCTACLSWRR